MDKQPNLFEDGEIAPTAEMPKPDMLVLTSSVINGVDSPCTIVMVPTEKRGKEELVAEGEELGKYLMAKLPLTTLLGLMRYLTSEEIVEVLKGFIESKKERMAKNG